MMEPRMGIKQIRPIAWIQTQRLQNRRSTNGDGSEVDRISNRLMVDPQLVCVVTYKQTAGDCQSSATLLSTNKGNADGMFPRLNRNQINGGTCLQLRVQSLENTPVSTGRLLLLWKQLLLGFVIAKRHIP